MRRREQVKRQRRAAAGEGWMFGEAEQFLHPNRDRRAAFGFVINGDRRAGRRDEMRRRLAVEAPRQSVRQHRVQRGGEILGRKIGKAGLAEEMGRQPVGARRQGFIADIGP